MAKSIDQVIREISKNFGDITYRGAPKDEDEPKLCSLGSISLDFCVYGGLKEGTINEFCGAEGSGKTTVACLAAAQYQRDNPQKAVLFVDLEATLDKSWAAKLGVRLTPEQFIYYKNEGQSGEVVFNHIVDFIKTGDVGFVILDSLPFLVPEFVQKEDDMEQKSMGGNAALLSDFVKRYTGLIRKQRVVFVGLQQLRENMTQYGDKEKTPGGRAWKHACSLRLMFKRGDFFDQEGEKVKKKDAQSPAGHIIEMYVLKNKNSPWDRKLGFTKLHYWKGIDYISDLTDVAVYFGLIDNSSVGWFKLLDENGKPLLDEKGEEIKINGIKKLAKYLANEKDISRRLYKEVKAQMLNKEPGYIKGFEEMLGVSTDFLVYEGDEDDEDEEEVQADEDGVVIEESKKKRKK